MIQEGYGRSISSVLRRAGKVVAFLAAGFAMGASPAASQQGHDHSGHDGHADGQSPHALSTGSQRTDDAAAHPEVPESGQAVAGPPLSLERIGNSAFAAIQEVVAELNARDDTDWSRVDLEALRQHLLDMQRFTLDAEVVEREQIDGGLRVAVRGPDAETHRSLRSSLEAHAPMLEQEMGWTVSVTEGEDRIVLEATADTLEEAERIRGLGYIGLMVSGSHHREHHWQIATGLQPHGHGH
ncbi:MAG: hypothetical protein ACOC5J_00095 [Gemmatimonadota bacterium]